MKRVRGRRIDFDPSWNPIRAMSVKTLAGLLLKDGLSEPQVSRRLRAAGYLGVEIRWAFSALNQPAKSLQPPLRARELAKRFDSANVVASA